MKKKIILLALLGLGIGTVLAFKTIPEQEYNIKVKATDLNFIGTQINVIKQITANSDMKAKEANQVGAILDSVVRIINKGMIQPLPVDTTKTHKKKA